MFSPARSLMRIKDDLAAGDYQFVLRVLAFKEI
jgi:hypothetical protein